MKSLEYISKKINDFNESFADKVEGVEVKPGNLWGMALFGAIDKLF